MGTRSTTLSRRIGSPAEGLSLSVSYSENSYRENCLL